MGHCRGEAWSEKKKKKNRSADAAMVPIFLDLLRLRMAQQDVADLMRRSHERMLIDRADCQRPYEYPAALASSMAYGTRLMSNLSSALSKSQPGVSTGGSSSPSVWL